MVALILDMGAFKLQHDGVSNHILRYLHGLELYIIAKKVKLFVQDKAYICLSRFQRRTMTARDTVWELGICQSTLNTLKSPCLTQMCKVSNLGSTLHYTHAPGT